MRRRLAVILPDGRRLSWRLADTVLGADVATAAATAMRISSSDSRLFGLASVDTSGQLYWIRPERPVVDYADGDGDMELVYSVRFFVNSVFHLEEPAAVEAYFVEAYHQIMKGDLNLSNQEMIRLCALLMVIFSNGESGQSASEIIQLVIPPPLRFLDSFQSECLKQYNAIKEMAKGGALLRFMQLAEQAPNYGRRLYSVRNGDGDCILAVSARGIAICNSRSPFDVVKNFGWKYLDNLYYRDNVFSIEVRDLGNTVSREKKQLDASVLQIGNNSPRAVTNSPKIVSPRPVAIRIFAYTCSSSRLCKAIWNDAISQHQFYLDEQAKRRRQQFEGTAVTSEKLNEQVNRLLSCSSLGSSLPSLSSLHSSSSTTLMPSAKIADGSSASQNGTAIKDQHEKRTDEEMLRAKERYNKLKSRRHRLEEELRERMKELLSICLREGEITGEMPKEIKKAILPGEEIPRLKKRIGTSFSIPEELIKADRADKLGQLETDVELHRRIVAAAERLAKDKSTNKSVRKKRQKDYQAAAQKLKGLEQGLHQMRLSASKPDISANSDSGNWSNGTAMAKSCPTTPRGSVPDLHQTDGEKSDFEDDDHLPRRAPSSASRPSMHQTEASSSSSSLGLPPSGGSRRSFATRSITSDELDNPLSSPIYENVGYRSTCYRSSYRQAHYPTLQDEAHQQQKKRAASAHSMAQRSSESYSSMSPLKALPASPADVVVMEPQRRMATSISFSGGFTSSSLDRRNVVRCSNGRNMSPSPSSTPKVTTTFPAVAPSDSHLPRFQPPIARLGARLNPSMLGHSISSGRLPAGADPQMEALLDYYKAGSRNKAKTATIV